MVSVMTVYGLLVVENWLSISWVRAVHWYGNVCCGFLKIYFVMHWKSLQFELAVLGMVSLFTVFRIEFWWLISDRYLLHCVITSSLVDYEYEILFFFNNDELESYYLVLTVEQFTRIIFMSFCIARKIK